MIDERFITKPHDFRYMGTNAPKRSMLVMLTKRVQKPLEHIYECPKCQSKYTNPQKLDVSYVNRELGRRFPCV